MRVAGEILFSVRGVSVWIGLSLKRGEAPMSKNQVSRVVESLEVRCACCGERDGAAATIVWQHGDHLILSIYPPVKGEPPLILTIKFKNQDFAETAKEPSESKTGNTSAA